MEENIEKFSCRARFICRKSDPAQPIHFLSLRSYKKLSTCVVCEEGDREWGQFYHLHCDTCDYDIHKGCYSLPRCRRSELTKPHTLEKRYGVFSSCFSCRCDLWDDDTYYYCNTCKVSFHEVCHLYPPEIRHPFHSLHPLKLTFSSSDDDSSSFSDLKDLPDSWQEEPLDSETEPDASDDVTFCDVRCKCCQRRLQKAYYHCSLCDFNLNITCTRNPPFFTILNPKSHDHALTIFPRRVHAACDACGLSLKDTHDLVYACLPCNFMVHKTCIYLPRLIKITRHPHRLLLSSSLPSGEYHCGVCRLAVDVTYGQFVCNKGCHYAVHSKCAVEGRVWDGIDLEGVPEEPEENMEPFERIDDETIQHFSHDQHHLKFRTNNELVCDTTRFCQACNIPIPVSENFYTCIHCDFILHEACASLPRKKDHPLHKHTLILHPVPLEPFESDHVQRRMRGHFSTKMYTDGMFKCDGCDQIGNGFMYKCGHNDCKFHLDTRCASFDDPLIHGSHPHELFFNLTKGECLGCKTSDCSSYYLECMQSKSFLGLKCASLPRVTHYKHDVHPLVLCYGEKDHITSGNHWCEICEATLDTNKWFYACNDYCCTTIHVTCLLGKQIFWKPASFRSKVNITDISFSVIRNNGNTRAECCICSRRSVEPYAFKFNTSYAFRDVCSFDCAVARILQ